MFNKQRNEKEDDNDNMMNSTGAVERVEVAIKHVADSGTTLPSDTRR